MRLQIIVTAIVVNEGYTCSFFFNVIQNFYLFLVNTCKQPSSTDSVAEVLKNTFGLPSTAKWLKEHAQIYCYIHIYIYIYIFVV